MRFFLLFCFFAVCAKAPVQAQVRVTFIIDSSTYSIAGSLFVAGNFNSWNPSDSASRFINGRLTITTSKDANLEYKITRGSWLLAETDSNGNDISNRVLKPATDTTVRVQVRGFKSGIVQAKKHTASEHVVLLDSAFYMPSLNRSRRVTLYLPPDYDVSLKTYPVLYMTDGQNCFDEYSAPFGEWQVDEALDRLYDSCGKSLIVVAVDHGNALRMSEYEPYPFRDLLPEGKQYAAFIAETLMPYIDRHYRTKTSATFTHVAGSSMGGLINMYMLAKYPEHFGGGGIFSPAFWTSASIYDDAKKAMPKLKSHTFFFYAGGRESEKMVKETTAMYKLISTSKSKKIVLYIDDAAGHNESAWRKWFPLYLQFILQ